MERLRGYVADFDPEIDGDTSFYNSENEASLSCTIYNPVAESTRIDSYHGRMSLVKQPNSRSISDRKDQMSSAYSSDDDQSVPDVRVVEGCEAEEAEVPVRTDVITTAAPRQTYLSLSKRSCRQRACRHHPRASSTMIEEEEDDDDDLELSGQSTDTSVVTWTIHEDSELIQLEDSYMRNIDNKLVPVFGFTAKNSYAKYSISSAESLKYEDGRTSVVSSDKFQSQPGPLMNSTRNDFHFVPEPKVDVCGDEEVTSMFEDPNHVTPENPLGLEQKAMIKKPTKAKKFSNIFKQNRLKQTAHVDNSPTKKKLFSSEISKESHALGKIRIMKKLKQFGDTLRSTDKRHLQQLAIL